VPAPHWGFIVNRNYSPETFGMGHHHLERVVVALAGCGRKGGPTCRHSSAGRRGRFDPDGEEAGRPSVFNPIYGTDAPQGRHKGRKKPFVYRPLIND